MRNKKLIILAILLSSFYSINLTAQNIETTKGTLNKKYLKALTKANEKDLISKEIQLDGESIPIYNIDGKRIRGMEMMNAMTSGNYFFDAYIDKNKDIKVVVLRIAKEKEKKMMMAQMSDKSELIGKDASAFTATDINGNEYSLNNLKGKIIVMNFWFVECKPCVMEMPELNRLVENYKNKDIVFLGFATNDKSKIDSFLKSKNFSYNIIPNSRKIAAEYKVSSYPTHIIINENSKIVYSTSGLGPNTITDIEKTIESLITAYKK